MPTFGRANHRKSPGAVSPYRPLNLEKETRGGAPLLMTQSSQSKSLFFSCSDPLANKYIIQSITCNFGLSSRRAAIAKCVQKEIPSELFHGRNAGRRSATKRNHQREICTLSLGAINPDTKIIINHENAISLSLNDNSSHTPTLVCFLNIEGTPTLCIVHISNRHRCSAREQREEDMHAVFGGKASPDSHHGQGDKTTAHLAQVTQNESSETPRWRQRRLSDSFVQPSRIAARDESQPRHISAN